MTIASTCCNVSACILLPASPNSLRVCGSSTSGIPGYAPVSTPVHSDRSPFLRHGRKTVGDAIVSLSQDLKRSRGPESLFISMGVGSMIFFGAGLALFVYEHFIR